MALRLGISLAMLLALSISIGNSQTTASDPQGVAVLAQTLNLSGAAVNPVRGFTASGLITYFWAGERVQGPATIRAQGHDQFRLDADLPDGRRSSANNRRKGARKDGDGTLTEIPAHNAMSLGTPSLPYAAIAAVLADPSKFTVSYVGLVELGGRQVHQVRVVGVFSPERDPDGILAWLSRTDYFVDAQTFLVSKTEDWTHPVETLTESYSHEVELEGYTAMSGVAVPTLVREKVSGQTMWEFRLTNIAFNTDHTDADFSVR